MKWALQTNIINLGVKDVRLWHNKWHNTKRWSEVRNWRMRWGRWLCKTEEARTLLGVNTSNSMASTLTGTLRFDIVASSLFVVAFFLKQLTTLSPSNYFYTVTGQIFTRYNIADNYMYILVASISQEPSKDSSIWIIRVWIRPWTESIQLFNRRCRTFGW